MSTRMLGFVALLSTYTLIALYLAGEWLRLSLFVLPPVLMSLLSLTRRWSSPPAIALVGLGALLPVCLLNIERIGPFSLLLAAVLFVAAALFGLFLVEGGDADARDDFREFGEDDLVAEDTARSIVARELRRSRRTGAPLSLLVLRGIAALEPSERRALANFLRVRGREFDIAFARSPDELAILCVDTDRAGVREYLERIRAAARVTDYSIASFPDDAVTLQGLFDATRGAPNEQGARAVAAIVAE